MQLKDCQKVKQVRHILVPKVFRAIRVQIVLKRAHVAVDLLTIVSLVLIDASWSDTAFKQFNLVMG